jgi:hypothetical protein
LTKVARRARRQFTFEQGAACQRRQILKKRRSERLLRRDSVNDYVRTSGNIQDGVGPEPARRVDTVAEEDEQAATNLGFTKHDSGKIVARTSRSDPVPTF